MYILIIQVLLFCLKAAALFLYAWRSSHTTTKVFECLENDFLKPYQVVMAGAAVAVAKVLEVLIVLVVETKRHNQKQLPMVVGFTFWI